MTSPVALVTDSSALLPATLARRRRIEVVPVTVVLDGRPAEEADVDVDTFFERLAAGASVSTATPAPRAFTDAYDRLAATGAREVISLHLDERVSGVLGAARLGADAASLPVHVVDTGQVSFGVALCALEARRALDDRAGPVAAIGAALRFASGMRNASFVAAPPSPGRIAAGNTLVAVAGGTPSVLESDVDAVTAPARLAAHVLSAPGPLAVAIGHAGPEARPGAGVLARLLGEAPSVRTVLRYRVGPSVGAHTGSGAFGCFWWPWSGASPGAGLD